MLGAIIMFFVGFRAKVFKWWHGGLLLFLSGLAANLTANRLREGGVEIDALSIVYVMGYQMLIEALAYGAGLWLGIAWSVRKSGRVQASRNDEVPPPSI